MIDGHIHFARSMDGTLLNEIIETYGLDAVALQCIPKGGKIPVERDAFWFREQSSIPVYIFGGIARDIYEFPKEHLAEELCTEVDRLLDLGCDGIKMLEGKPDVRKRYPIPDFDDAVWDGYFTKLERLQIPLVFHVNDPEEFWNEDEVTEFAKSAGWFYDETFVNNEKQYEQIFSVLERHPKLNVLFPHFLFLSKHLGQLTHILRTYPNVMIDVTPAAEQIYHLSDQREKAVEFFRLFGDRICYGTDIGARALIQEKEVTLCMEESHARIDFIKKFLESAADYLYTPDGSYIREGKPTVMHGLGLSSRQLDQIYGENFMNFIRKSKRQRCTV